MKLLGATSGLEVIPGKSEADGTHPEGVAKPSQKLNRQPC
jgi:hypothetical protein